MNINVFSSFEDAKKVWNTFEESGDYYGFQCFQWLHHWYQTIGQFKKHKLCFVYIRSDDNKPLIFLPLIIEYKGIVRCLTWQGDILSDYQAPLLSQKFSQNVSEDDFKLLWQNILRVIPKFDVIHFQKIPEYVGSQRNPFLFINLSPHRENSYAVLLSGADSWDNFYFRQVKKKIRLDSKRQRKRLSDLGQLKFIIAQEFDDINIIIETMINQKSQRYREIEASDIFRKKCYRDFYHQSALSLVPLGLINVAALKLNDRILATHFGMVMGNTFYYLMPTYEGGGWGKYSCGRLLLEYLLEWSFKQGLHVFDFTVGGEQYKKDWCNNEMKLYELILANNSIGQIYVLIQKLRKSLINYPNLLKFLTETRARTHDVFR